MGSATPVMNAARSEQSHTTALATSSVVPTRPMFFHQRNGFFAFMLAACTNHHAGSFGGERQRRCAPDAGTAAGDRGDFVLKKCG